MSAQRLPRWLNIVQMLYKCVVFAGMAPVSLNNSEAQWRFGLKSVFCGRSLVGKKKSSSERSGGVFSKNGD